jgi:hypothetical protein
MDSELDRLGERIAEQAAQLTSNPVSAETVLSAMALTPALFLRKRSRWRESSGRANIRAASGHAGRSVGKWDGNPVDYGQSSAISSPRIA